MPHKTRQLLRHNAVRATIAARAAYRPTPVDLRALELQLCQFMLPQSNQVEGLKMNAAKSSFIKAIAKSATVARTRMIQFARISRRRFSRAPVCEAIAHSTSGTDRYIVDQYNATDLSGDPKDAAIPTRPYNAASPSGPNSRDRQLG